MNCDLIAPHYWWIERLGMGRALERRRRWFLPEIGNARRALVLGDGDGRFLRELLRHNSLVRADYVDLSRRMLALARQKAGNKRVDYQQADALTVELPPDEYDLIATHFFFDCFGPSELELLIKRVGDAAKPGAKWIVSEFRTPTIPARHHDGAQDPHAGGSSANLASARIPANRSKPFARCVSGFGAVGTVERKAKRGQVLSRA
jgi:SAM-dependent methyltransferase